MTDEQLQDILNYVIKKEYPEIDMDIHVTTEHHAVYITSAKKLIYNIVFMLSPYEYEHTSVEGRDKDKWDRIRGLIRDIIKMSGISDKVIFYFRERIG
jgi:hypothetical protein